MSSASLVLTETETYSEACSNNCRNCRVAIKITEIIYSWYNLKQINSYFNSELFYEISHSIFFSLFSKLSAKKKCHFHNFWILINKSLNAEFMGQHIHGFAVILLKFSAHNQEHKCFFHNVLASSVYFLNNIRHIFVHVQIWPCDFILGLQHDLNRTLISFFRYGLDTL